MRRAEQNMNTEKAQNSKKERETERHNDQQQNKGARAPSLAMKERGKNTFPLNPPWPGGAPLFCG